MTYMKILVFFHIIADFYTNYKFNRSMLRIYLFIHFAMKRLPGVVIILSLDPNRV